MYPSTETYEIKIGDNWAETIVYTAYDENNAVTTFTVPTRTQMQIRDKENTLIATLDSDASASPDGSMTITQNGDTVQVSWNLPDTITEGMTANTNYVADMVFIGQADLGSPFTIHEIPITTYKDYTVTS